MAHNSSKKPLPNPYENEILTTRGSVTDREIITAYGPKKRQQLLFIGDGATKQSMKDECDINRIMARYQVTGVLPEQLQPGHAQYVDVTGIDYQTGMQQIAAANSLFQGLPAAVRLKFENDPAKFLDFAQDGNNSEALIEMGLATRPPHEPLPVEAPQVASVSTARSTAPKSSSKASQDPPSQTLPGIPDSEK